MRQRFLSALAACIAAVSCSQKDCDYIEELKSCSTQLMMDIKANYQDSSLSRNEQDDRADTLYVRFCTEAGKIVEDGLALHQDDSVAVFIISFLKSFEITDDATILEKIRNLGPNARQAKEIQELETYLETTLKSAPGTQFIDFEAKDLGGNTVKLSEYAGCGKYCLVDFWASWCSPCKREIANLKKIHQKYGKDLEMVSVAVWDEKQASIDTAKAYGITWRQMVDAGSVPTDLYGIMGIPHIMLVSPDGKILSRGLQGRALVGEIEKYL